MGKSIYLLLAYALFSACTVQVTAQKQVSEEKIEPFPVEKSLQAEKIKVNEVFFLDGIKVKKGSIFALDSKSTDTLCINIHSQNFNVFTKEGEKEGQKMNSKFLLHYARLFLIKSIFLDTLHSSLKVLHWTATTICHLRKNWNYLFMTKYPTT